MRSLLCLLLLASPSPAWACWDGTTISGTRVSIDYSDGADGGGPWRLADARAAATWLPRIEALVPRRARLSLFVERGDVQLERCDARGAACRQEDLRAGDTDWPHLFRLVARRLHADAATVASARARPAARAYTVEALLTTDARRADALAGAIDDLDDLDPGFYRTGGHPGRALPATVERSDGSYRVLVGVYRDRASAKEARDRIRAVTCGEAVVRRL